MTAKIKSHAARHKSHARHKPKGLANKSFNSVYWPYIPILAITGLILMLATQSGVIASMVSHPTGKVLAYALSVDQANLLANTNDSRLAYDKAPLKINPVLSKAAQAKAEDMARRNYWSHNTPGGNPPWIFVEAENYAYQKLGENLAAGFTDSRSTVRGWMSSPEHKDNMLDGDYSEVGFGFANSSNYTAAGGGPMTVVVAYYGQPSVLGASAVGSVASEPSPPPAPSHNAPAQALAATRAQLSIANSPIASYATLITFGMLAVVIGAWISRHLFVLKSALSSGESFIVSHPFLDVSFVVLGLSLYALSRTAGFIH